MSAWAVAGQSLSLIVGGVGLGLGLAFGGMLWNERDRAGDLQDAFLGERMGHLNTTADLATCRAGAALLREGREIDLAIPNDLIGVPVPDDWRVRPLERPAPN